MCPGHPNIHHDSARCPTTSSSTASYPGPPRSRDLAPTGRGARDMVKEERRSNATTCDASWCNCDSVDVDAGAGAGL